MTKTFIKIYFQSLFKFIVQTIELKNILGDTHRKIIMLNYGSCYYI